MARVPRLFRDCPNIVQLYGYSEEPPALVMERFDTDLATILHSDLELSQETVLHLIEQWGTPGPGVGLSQGAVSHPAL